MATQTKKKKGDKKLAGVKFVTPRFRLSFPHCFEPHKATDDAPPKYSITMLVPKDSEEFKTLKGKLREAAAEAFGADPKKWPKISWPWRDGDEQEQYAGYAGHYAISADTNDPPGVVNRDREDIVNPRDLYAGGFARAEVTAKAIVGVGVDDDKKPKNWVKFYLQHVWFLGGGEKFGPGGNAKDAFADIDEDFEVDDSHNEQDDEDYDDMSLS
jgi:hypothetical protein